MIQRLQSDYEIYVSLFMMIVVAYRISPTGIQRRYRWEGREGESLEDYLKRPYVMAIVPGGKCMIGSFALLILLKLSVSLERTQLPLFFVPMLVGMLVHLVFMYKAWQDSLLTE